MNEMREQEMKKEYLPRSLAALSISIADRALLTDSTEIEFNTQRNAFLRFFFLTSNQTLFILHQIKAPFGLMECNIMDRSEMK
jgi:hypothetical protein